MEYYPGCLPSRESQEDILNLSMHGNDRRRGNDGMIRLGSEGRVLRDDGFATTQIDNTKTIRAAPHQKNFLGGGGILLKSKNFLSL